MFVFSVRESHYLELMGSGRRQWHGFRPHLKRNMESILVHDGDFSVYGLKKIAYLTPGWYQMFFKIGAMNLEDVKENYRSVVSYHTPIYVIPPR